MEDHVWVLGFTYDDVIDAFQDARLADCIEKLWAEAGRPLEAEAWWTAAGDDYAFRWYLNDATAGLLDAAKVVWRRFVVGHAAGPPAGAFRFLNRSAA